MRFLDPKNRRDHIVPRVYLRGFIHPGRDTKNGPLEVFHLSSNTWGAPQTLDDLCAEVGFYDYSVERADTTADDVFKDLEDNFAIVRERLRRVAFSDWKRDRDFLLRFGKMLVVRSKMFRQGVIAAAAKQPAFRMLEVDGNKMRVEPMRLGTEPDADRLLKNRSITEMRTAIEEGAAEWAEWDWGLRRAPSVDCPFITSDHPPVMSGDGPDGLRAYVPDEEPSQPISESVVVETTPRVRKRHPWNRTKLLPWVDSTNRVRIRRWLDRFLGPVHWLTGEGGLPS